jgi:hypothetical protein
MLYPILAIIGYSVMIYGRRSSLGDVQTDVV